MLAFVTSIILGGGFVVAGAAKIASGAQWPQLAAAMGTPRALLPLVVRLLPGFEILLGALLIAQVQRRIVAGVALALLVAFTVQIVVQLRRRNHPVCACFGAWSAKPLGVGHLIRNAALMVLAAITMSIP